MGVLLSTATLIEKARLRRPLLLIGFDLVAWLLAYGVFALLRYVGPDAPAPWSAVLVLAVATAGLQIVIGGLLRMYQGRTKLGSLEDSVLLAFLTVGCGVLASLANATAEPVWIARSVPLAATFMALFLMGVGRATWRRQVERRGYGFAKNAAPTLIFGAGEGGRQLIRSMLRSPYSPLRPVGLIDDDKWKKHLRLEGVPVLGARDKIVDAAARTGATTLVIAVPSADPTLIRDVSAESHEAGLDVKILPGVHELFSNDISIRDIRDIDVADLLGRSAIETDVAAIAGYLTGKRVLVTGAGGSIGSELCRQIYKYGPSELIMLDRDESALHAVQLSMHGKAMLDTDDVVLADIRDVAALRSIFYDRRPEVVFHAAALKHLPMLEQYPAEAVKTNVVGTVNVLRASAAVGVERFVNISTDKAANPTSVLGYSKRVAERLTSTVAQDVPGSYLSVRFGNVLGSRGSVLTSFAAQIAAGGPVTVTHPEVTRYFMTIEEAVQLVIQAAAIGRDGEALILDMGEPVLIEDVARQLIDQSGEDIEIVYTGLRDGEKMHEELFADGESDERPAHPLVSHVTVPEIRVSRVTRAPMDVGREGVVEQLQLWCAVDHEPHASEHPDALPREWAASSKR